MYLDIDTYYIILLDNLTQASARNVPEPLGDPGRDVTDPFPRLPGDESILAALAEVMAQIEARRPAGEQAAA